MEGGDKGRERDIGCADGAQWRAGRERDIESGRTVRGGGRGQWGADGARWRAWCAVEGVDKGRERGRCAVEGGDKGREHDIGCADGARWRAGARYRVRRRCAVEGGDKGRERDIGCADGARWRAWTRGGSAKPGADGARWRAWTRGGSAGARYRVRGRCAVEGGDKGRERDIGCAVEGGDKKNPADFHSATILFAWVFGFPA